jgi:hypothetical protein
MPRVRPGRSVIVHEGERIYDEGGRLVSSGRLADCEVLWSAKTSPVRELESARRQLATDAGRSAALRLRVRVVACAVMIVLHGVSPDSRCGRIREVVFRSKNRLSFNFAEGCRR